MLVLYRSFSAEPFMRQDQLDGLVTFVCVAEHASFSAAAVRLGYDAGIRFGDFVEQDMVAVKVGPALRMRVIASPAYLARHDAPQHPSELLQHNCITFRASSLAPSSPLQVL